MISKQYFGNASGMFGHSVMNVMMNNELDIFGLNASEDGRCCGMHAVCGQQPAGGGRNDSMFPLGRLLRVGMRWACRACCKGGWK